jgi:hypothetical protein
MAILTAADILVREEVRDRTIFFLSDSQSALRALGSHVIRSTLVEKCHRRLNALSTENTVKVKWVRGHAGTHGNEVADQLAKEGALMPFEDPEPAVGVSPAAVRGCIRSVSLAKHDALWHLSNSCRQTKDFGIIRDRGRADALAFPS